MPVLLKLLYGDYKKESRDKREMDAARQAGFEIQVIQITRNHEDSGTVETVQGTDVYHWSYAWDYDRFIWPNFIRVLSYPVRLYQQALVVRRAKAAVISGHDINALFLAWLSTLFMSAKEKAKLVYDAHEFELGRNVKRGFFGTKCIAWLERFLMKRCFFTIAVNDSIADEMARIHKTTRPLVVRSTPNYWKVDPELTALRKNELLKIAGMDSSTFVLMYHGGIMRSRGIETLLEIAARDERLCAVIMGYSTDDEYMETLKNQAKLLGLGRRAVFIPAVEQSRIWEYAGAADAAMILIKGNVQNHIWSLPNKFFENIQSETPIIASAFPEMKRLIDQYGIGLCCNSDDLEDIFACVEKMREDKMFYANCKKNMSFAKKELCWEKEKQPLVEIYRNLFLEIYKDGVGENE